MKQSTIEIKNLTKTFDDLAVLNALNYVFEQTKTYAITGVSGSGKSTLLHLLAGLDVPSSGEVLIDGHDIQTFTEKQKQHFLNKKVGLIFQEPLLMQELTVLENVMLKGMIAADNMASCTKRGMELLEYVGLHDRADAYPHQLSGGQQQRVAVVRAVFNKPEFILADEPTGNLDKDNADGVTELLLTLHKEFATGIIISTHDAHVARKMNNCLRLESGTLTFTMG